jgi:hypothetical protein
MQKENINNDFDDNFECTRYLIKNDEMATARIYSNFVKKNFNQINLSLLITLVMVSPHWLWYGEKNVMNAFFIWFFFSFLYRLIIKLF